jgi:hypothetical protein
VNFEWVESAVPPAVEVKDRHVERKHRIVHSPAAAEYFSQFGRETSLPNCRLSFFKESSTIHFIS